LRGGLIAANRERRRRDLFNRKRSRKELSRRLLSIDFSLVGQEEQRREEDDSDEDDDIYSGITYYIEMHQLGLRNERIVSPLDNSCCSLVAKAQGCWVSARFPSRPKYIRKKVSEITKKIAKSHANQKKKY
jgi:hypothetical protein